MWLHVIFLSGSESVQVFIIYICIAVGDSVIRAHHIGRLDFSLSWHMGEVRENLGDARISIKMLTKCPPTFHQTNVLHNDLKKDAIDEFGIKYCTSNPVWELLLREYWRKSMIIGEKNTDKGD